MLFLLPTNVYPSTGTVENDVIGGTLGHRIRVVVGELLPGRRSRSQLESEAPPTNGTAVDNAVPDAAAEAKPRRWRSVPAISLPRINPARVARRVFTPFRLLVLGMILVVATTCYWMYIRSRLETAHQTWRESTDAVAALVEGGDFEALQDTLNRATAAGRLIGQQGPEWRQMLNLLEETRAVTSVSFSTLPALLSDLPDDRPIDETELQSFMTDLMNGTFVIDGYIDPVGSDSGEYLLDIPAMTSGQPVSVTMRLPQLEEYLVQNPDRRFVFAFRLAGVDTPARFGRDSWKLTVAPESFVLITSEQHCHHLGFAVESDPTLAELLARQQRFVEGSERWAGRHQELAAQRKLEEEIHP